MKRSKTREVNIYSASVVDLFASGLGVFLIVSILALANQNHKQLKTTQKEKGLATEGGGGMAIGAEKTNSDLENIIKEKNEEIVSLKLRALELEERMQKQASLEELMNAKNEIMELKKKEIAYQENLMIAENELKVQKEETRIAQLTDQEYIDERFTDLDVGKKVTLENVQFYPGTDQSIEPYAGREIAAFARILRKNPQMTVEVSGHIYESKSLVDKGKANDDYNLSGRRAQYVCKRLQDYDISPKRMRCVGYGATRQIYLTNDQYSIQAQKNRRVEIEVLSK